MEIDEPSITNSPKFNTSKLSVCGRLRFGLTHPEVSPLLRELPNFDKAMELFGTMSPPSKRKYHSMSDDSADEGKQKAPKNGDSFSRSASFSSRDDMDDLESAVATLQTLKYCSVF